MGTQNYGKITSGRAKKLRRRITGIAIILIIALAGAFVIGILTEDSAEYRLHASAVEENHALKERAAELEAKVAELEAQLAELQGQLTEKDEYIASIPTEAPEESAEPAPESDWVQTSPRESGLR